MFFTVRMTGSRVSERQTFDFEITAASALTLGQVEADQAVFAPQVETVIG